MVSSRLTGSYSLFMGLSLLFVGLVLMSCNSEYSFRPVSSFRITDTALLDGDTVDVIYCSGGPEKVDDFYYYLIAKRVRDGKKVNILADDISTLSQEKSRKVFFSSTSKLYRLSMNARLLGPNAGIDKIQNQPVKPFEKVVIGKRFTDEEHNRYPTAVGTVNLEFSENLQNAQDISKTLPIQR